MHLFAIDLNYATGSLTAREASFSAFLVSGSSSMTDSQVFVDEVAIDVCSSRVRSNWESNCFSKIDDYFRDQSNHLK